MKLAKLSSLGTKTTHLSSWSPLYLRGVFWRTQSHHSEKKSEFTVATLSRSAGRRGGWYDDI